MSKEGDERHGMKIKDDPRIDPCNGPIIEITDEKSAAEEPRVSTPPALDFTAHPNSAYRSPERTSPRKQLTPTRSLKQIDSTAEKIRQGIVVLDPQAISTAIEFAEVARTLSPVPSFGTSTQHQRIIMTSPNYGTLGSPVSNATSTPSKKRYKVVSTGDSLVSSPRVRQPRQATESLRDWLPSPQRSPSPLSDGESSGTSLNGHLMSDAERKVLLEELKASQAVLSTDRSREAIYVDLVKRRKTGTGPSRPITTPLDLVNDPSASFLTDSEFTLCATLRLTPAQYFTARTVLVVNNRRRGFYRKSAAQKMLRIDVNKTGKIYDFCVERGWMPMVEGGEVIEPPEVPEEMVGAADNIIARG